MVVAGPQAPTGEGPHAQGVPHGQPPMQGPRHPLPGSFRGPPPDRQQQPNWHFFYMQPSQPYLPCQWPMPMAYVPYGGFPGLGYGMMAPPFPPASYAEAPGYILPYAQLHMVDYRRMMAPHLAPSMAYQARRFRYQHMAPQGRVMVSSEVQTESVCSESPQRDSATSCQTSSESGRSSGSVVSSPRLLDGKAAYPDDCMKSSNESTADKVATTSTVTSPAVPNSGILFQTEEVRIECSGTPAGLNIVHTKETTELASNANGELLQCNVGSVHSAEDVVLRCYPPLAFEASEQKKCTDDLNHSDEQYLSACPDILMMGGCPSSGNVTALEGSDVAPVEQGNSTEIHTLMVQGDPSLVKGDDVCGNSKSMLAFKLERLDNLSQMEASVWSVESVVPFVPSTEWMMQNGLLTPSKPTLTPVLEVPAEDPAGSNQNMADSNTSPQESVQFGTVGVLDGPPYLPSASWLADLRNVYYSKLPCNVQQQTCNPNNCPEGQLCEGSDVCQDVQTESSVGPNSADLKCKRKDERKGHKPTGHHLFNQESSAQLREDLTPPHEHKARICKSCQMRFSAGLSTRPCPKANGVKQHKVAPHLSGVEVNLCAVCMLDPEKKARYPAAASGIHGIPNGNETPEVEVSENYLYPSVGHKKGPAGDRKKVCKSQKLSPGRHSENCPGSHQSKLRELNCSCEGPKGLSRSSLSMGSNGHGHHNVTCERNEENLALSATERWRDAEQRFISQKQKEKRCAGGMQVSDSESTKSGRRMRVHHRHKKSCAQTPEIHRRDTRC